MKRFPPPVTKGDVLVGVALVIGFALALWLLT